MGPQEPGERTGEAVRTQERRWIVCLGLGWVLTESQWDGQSPLDGELD